MSVYAIHRQLYIMFTFINIAIAKCKLAILYIHQYNNKMQYLLAFFIVLLKSNFVTLFTHFVHLANFSDSVLDVNISLSRDSPLYSGTTLNLTCTTTRHCNLNTGEVITATWSGPRDITGERYTISQSTFSRGINISLTISPLTVVMMSMGMIFLIL